MKKLSMLLVGAFAIATMSFTVVDYVNADNNTEFALLGNEVKTYNVKNVPATLNFTSIPASSSFSVSASNTGNRSANFQIWSSYGEEIGSFDVPAGLSYTPVYYFSGGTGGYVRIIVTRDDPSSGNVKGTVSVSN